METAVKTAYLKSLLADEQIVIPVTSGLRRIANAKDVFTHGIDLDFERLGTNKPSGGRLETDVKVFEPYQEATLKQMFMSFGELPDDLCMTEEQIIVFCEKHKDKLHRGRDGNFFLFKLGDEFFVAIVSVMKNDEMYARLRYLKGNGHAWFASQHRLFVPAAAFTE